MFNNISEIVSHISYISLYETGDSYHRYGVLLPHSTKILTSNDIDKKIVKTKKHIEYLSNQLPFDNRGGKAFRAKKVSVLQQITLSISRLKLLEQAKAIVLDPLKITKPSAPVQRQPIMFKDAEDAFLFASNHFYKIIEEGIQNFPIYGKHREILERTINHLEVRGLFVASDY